jgi:uncharacterized protein YlzI (FlbEa/FlbD family)
VAVIKVKDLRGNEFIINAELIEKIENNPETQVIMTNTHRYYVQNTLDELAELVVAYRGACRAACAVFLQKREE